MKDFLLKLWNDEEGAELVEWLIVVAAIAAIAAGIWATLGPAANSSMSNIVNQMK